ncbi:E3 ubiquitin-protein ligase ZSWIM2, partial [Ciconia maguari]
NKHVYFKCVKKELRSAEGREQNWVRRRPFIFWKDPTGKPRLTAGQGILTPVSSSYRTGVTDVELFVFSTGGKNAFKLGLLEREIEDVLQQLHQERTQNPEGTLRTDITPGRRLQKFISLCREKFAPLMFILEEFRHSKQLVTATEKPRLDRHLGIPCNNGRVFPIILKCYKQVFLNQDFDSAMSLSKRNKKWRALQPLPELSAQGGTFKSSNPGNNSEEEILYLQDKTSCTPKNIVKSLPIILISKHSNLLAPGIQCRLGLKSFQLGQHVRLLPCNHKFHRECIDSWLLQQRNTCPIDEYVVYNPLTWKDTPTNHGNYPLGSHAKVSKLAKQVEPEICVSGNGLFLKEISSEHASESSQNSF